MRAWALQLSLFNRLFLVSALVAWWCAGKQVCQRSPSSLSPDCRSGSKWWLWQGPVASGTSPLVSVKQVSARTPRSGPVVCCFSPHPIVSHSWRSRTIPCSAVRSVATGHCYAGFRTGRGHTRTAFLPTPGVTSAGCTTSCARSARYRSARRSATRWRGVRC